AREASSLPVAGSTRAAFFDPAKDGTTHTLPSGLMRAGDSFLGSGGSTGLPVAASHCWKPPLLFLEKRCLPSGVKDSADRANAWPPTAATSLPAATSMNVTA